jgi:hypothetical protein
MPDHDGVCMCGHPAEAHGLVPGFECAPNVTIDGATTVPDVWVCEGGRLVAVTEDTSPWDGVCGCVLHEDPRERAA